MASSDRRSASVVFDGDLVRAEAVREGGGHVLCPRCSAELVFADTLEAANLHGVHPSIYCPTDRKHVFVMLNLTSTRDTLRKLFGPGRHEDDKSGDDKPAKG